MSTLPDLRPYQHAMIAEIEAAWPTYRRVLAVLPTGGGKTVVMAEIIRRETAAHRKVLVLAHRREIIAQTSRKLQTAHLVHGLIMPGETYRQTLDIQVATVQTLHTRAIRRQRMSLPPADLVVIDETHHATAETYRSIMEAYPNARVLGLTATPTRCDGRGLGGIFEALVEGPQVDDLVALGFLVPTRVYAPPPPDLRGVGTRAGDYVLSDLAERLDKDALVGDIVEHWLRYAQHRRTVAFATSVAHSLHIRNAFREQGIKAEHIDGNTPTDERDAVLAMLARGETTVLVNCQVLTEGFDCPDLGCCILARPTKSLGLYRQMVGRVLRPSPGKSFATVLDHAGATWRHGFAEDPIAWALSEDSRPENDKHTARIGDGEPASRIIQCSQCGALRVAGEACTACGFLPSSRAPRPVDVVDGVLGLVYRASRKAKAETADIESKRQFYAELLGFCRERGWSSGAAFYKFQERYGERPPWPRHQNPAAVAPSAATRAWIKSRAIAFAKSRELGAA